MTFAETTISSPLLFISIFDPATILTSFCLLFKLLTATFSSISAAVSAKLALSAVSAVKAYGDAVRGVLGVNSSPLFMAILIKYCLSNGRLSGVLLPKMTLNRPAITGVLS